MKNYLYILCAFLLAFAGCTKDADVEPIAPAPDENAQVVLTGFSGRGTRTGFGGAEDGAVPFLWSAGDYIWASNTRSEAIAEGGSQATFIFESIATADTYDVFYNLTGPAAATALIPAEQTQQAADELNLGQNGDFGYAKAQNRTVPHNAHRACTGGENQKKRVVERQSFVCRSHPRSQCHGTAADEGDRHPENPARHYDIA